MTGPVLVFGGAASRRADLPGGGRGFTLVELLVVVAILALLVGILSPSLHQAQQLARAAVCRGQFHEIGNAFTTFTTQHEGTLPGLWGPPWTGPEDWQGSWMGSEVFTTSYQPPPAARPGTLLDFVGGADTARKLYRCPGLDVAPWGSGQGSNGLFDYSMIQALPGAKLPLLGGSAFTQHPVTGEWMSSPIPLVLEEDPAYHLNLVFFDMGHTTINRIGTWHPNGSGQFIAVDGSSHTMSFGDSLGAEASARLATAPSGTVKSLGPPLPYGGWNDQ